MTGDLLAGLAWAAAQAVPPVLDIRPEPVINTGAGLLENCTFDDRASSQADLEFHLGLCIGFIKGVTNAWDQLNPGRICAPDDLSNQDLRDVVVRWLRSRPESLDQPAVGSVVSAATEAFPCNARIQVE